MSLFIFNKWNNIIFYLFILSNNYSADNQAGWTGPWAPYGPGTLLENLQYFFFGTIRLLLLLILFVYVRAPSSIILTFC